MHKVGPCQVNLLCPLESRLLGHNVQKSFSLEKGFADFRTNLCFYMNRGSWEPWSSQKEWRVPCTTKESSNSWSVTCLRKKPSPGVTWVSFPALAVPHLFPVGTLLCPASPSDTGLSVPGSAFTTTKYPPKPLHPGRHRVFNRVPGTQNLLLTTLKHSLNCDLCHRYLTFLVPSHLNCKMGI